MATTTKVPEKLTPLAKAMLVPILTEAEIKDALGEDEVKNCERLFLHKSKCSQIGFYLVRYFTRMEAVPMENTFFRADPFNTSSVKSVLLRC